MNLQESIQYHFKDLSAAGTRLRTTILASPESKGFHKFKSTLTNKLVSRLRSFNNHGNIGKLSNDLKSELSDAYIKAYTMGAGTKEISTKEKSWINSVQKDQFKFLDGFLSDVNADEGRMDYATRLKMYAEKVDSVYWAGAVKSLEDDTEIDWVTMAGESCEDCLELEENGPYSPDELPTTPRAGDTACIMNCQCVLSVHKVKS